jgi:hypothetical protein
MSSRSVHLSPVFCIVAAIFSGSPAAAPAQIDPATGRHPNHYTDVGRLVLPKRGPYVPEPPHADVVMKTYRGVGVDAAFGQLAKMNGGRKAATLGVR